MKKNKPEKIQPVTREFILNEIKHLKNKASLFDKIIPIFAGFVFTSLIFYLSRLNSNISEIDVMIITILFIFFVFLIINMIWFSRINIRIQDISQIENSDLLYIKTTILERQLVLPVVLTQLSFVVLIIVLFITILLIFKELSILIIYSVIFFIIFFAIDCGASAFLTSRLKKHLYEELKKDHIGIERSEKFRKKMLELEKENNIQKIF